MMLNSIKTNNLLKKWADLNRYLSKDIQMTNTTQKDVQHHQRNANILFQSVGSFHFFYCFHCCANAFEFKQVSIVVYFCFYLHYSGRWIKKDVAVTYVRECSAYISSKSFIVSGLTFWSSTILSLFLCMELRNDLISLFHMCLSNFPSAIC